MSSHPPPPPQCPSPAPPPPPSGPSSSSAPSGPSPASRWFFTDEQLNRSPSILSRLPQEKELSYRQQAANFIQDMGQRLQVTQLCINTAIVYMQRFYMFHSFTRFHRNTMASAALFLAAKVEEQPRKLEHVIKVAHICLHRDQPQLDTRSEAYQEQAAELVANENILLQTLGFDVAIDHPHTHVVRCCQLVKASKELAQTSYFMATNSLHLTTMCLRYSPTTVACVCIHLACKWSNYKIPTSREGKAWFQYIDSNAKQELLDRLTEEFLTIFEKCPSRLKRKIMASTEATKQEEERRAKGDIMPSQYQPDLNVRRGEAQSSTATPTVVGGHGQRSAAATPTGTPAQTAITPMSTPKVLHGGKPSPNFSSRPDKSRPQPDSLKRPHPSPLQDDVKRRRTGDAQSHLSHQRPSQPLYDASKIQHRLPHNHQQHKAPGSHGSQQSASGHHASSSRPGSGHPRQPSSSAAHHKAASQQLMGSNGAGSSKHSNVPPGQHHAGHGQRAHHHQNTPQSMHNKSHHTGNSGDHHSSQHHRAHPDGRRNEGHHGTHPSRQQPPHTHQKAQQGKADHQHSRHNSASSHHGSHHHPGSKHMPPQTNAQARPASSSGSSRGISATQQRSTHQAKQQNQAPGLSQQPQQPQRSIFDIDVNSTSPLNTGRSSSLGNVFDPINSPASSLTADITDIFGANGAADMDLEDGEIIDSKSEVGAMLLSNSALSEPKLPFDSTAVKAEPTMKTEPSMGFDILNGNSNSAPNIAKMLSSSSQPRQMTSLADSKPAADSSSSAARKRPSPVTTRKLFGEEEDEDEDPEPTDSRPNLMAARMFGMASKQRTPSPKKKVHGAPTGDDERKGDRLPNSSKPPSLFSPPNVRPDGEGRNRTASSSSADEKSPSIKLSKLETMTGYEKMKDGRKSIKVNKDDRATVAPVPQRPQQQPMMPQQQMDHHQVAQVKPMMPVSIPLSSVKQDGLADEERRRREHKEKKKKKKEKKEKKEKDKRKDKDEASSSSSKKSKKKSKDRERERGGGSAGSSHPGSLASSPAPSSSQQSGSSLSGTVPKLKIKIGTSSSSSGAAATEVAPSSSTGGGGDLTLRFKTSGAAPAAAKMSRVLGTPHDVESMYYTNKVDHHKKSSKSHV